ncbi:protein N-lysine methyltransferase METTL21A [Pelomyxa schiedti]|nr:protein N-lysine methyltransferase METTL21A [Pelomyxa schiedti]
MADDGEWFDPGLFLNEDYSTLSFEFGGVAVNLLALKSASTDHDLTGQVVWPSAQVLSQFIVENRDLFRNKEVLELGAGVGLCGLVVANFASRVTLTDYHEVVLKALQKNVDHSGFPHVSCCKLLWGENLPSFSALHGTFDAIIGSDIVFWHDCIEPLFLTVDHLLKTSEDAFFVTSYASRASITDRVHLFQVAERHRFEWTVLPLPSLPNSTFQEEICLVKFHRRMTSS